MICEGCGRRGDVTIQFRQNYNPNTTNLTWFSALFTTSSIVHTLFHMVRRLFNVLRMTDGRKMDTFLIILHCLRQGTEERHQNSPSE
jgi:hypothetical protein